MDNKKEIQIVKKLNVTDLAGEKVMVDFDTGKYFMIKGVGNDIWDMIQEKITVEKIIETLLEEYEVSREECEEAVIKFLEQMQSYGFIK